MVEIIIKRDGSEEIFSADKINRWAHWAAEHLGGFVDWSGIAMRAVGKLPKRCPSQDLQIALIQECLDQKKWSYYRMAARLYVPYLRKKLYNDDIPTIQALHAEMTQWGLMRELKYSDAEYAQINEILQHKRDFNYAYFQIKQIVEKYSLHDRRKDSESAILGRYFEMPQFVYMRMAMALAEDEAPAERMMHLKKWYDHLSCNRLNAPTPNFTNLGTTHNGYASCFPAGSMVMTSEGRKPIEDIKVGDRVLTHRNRFRNVYHVQDKPYSGRFVRVNTVASFTDQLCPTEDHRILAIKSAGSNVLARIYAAGGHEKLYRSEWIKADNLRVGDYVKLPFDKEIVRTDLHIWDVIKDNLEISQRYELSDDKIVPLYKWRKEEHSEANKYPVIANANIMNEDLFRLFGYYLAEGCVCTPSRGDYCKHLIFTFATKETVYIEDVKQIVERLGGRVSISANPNDNSTKISIHSKPITELFHTLFGSGFSSKRLPASIVKASPHLQQQLLVGILRGDGCAVIQGYTLTLANVELITQLRDIALRSKIRLNLSRPNAPKPGETAPRATIVFNIASTELGALVGKNYEKCRIESGVKGNNVLFIGDDAYARVRLLSSYEKECTVYDLSVVEDESFSVNGVAVHNCCLYVTDDTEKSLGIGDHIARTMTVASAGIGGALLCRSMNDPVRGGLIVHQGKTPYYKALAGAVNSSVQNGRGGACTTYFSIYDPEVMTLMNLRHPKAPEDRRILTMDFAVELNKHIIRKALDNEDVFLFNTHTAPDLVRAFYDSETGLFERLYAKYEADPKFKKTYVSARKLIISAYNISIETGSLYLLFIDEVNRHTPFYDPIYSSNLCVAPETMLMTDRGHFPIASLEGQSVNVWNGQEFSNTTVVKTAENQELWTVQLSDGRALDCTAYHKWYKPDGYTGRVVETRTHELEVGDRLIKCEWPLIEGHVELDRPYLNGFYCGDGTTLPAGHARVYLYGAKKNLRKKLCDTVQWRTGSNGKRLEAEFWGLQPKFAVPTAQASIQSRLQWLAGWLDADGVVYRNGTNEALTGSSNRLDFLKDIQYMLQLTGINAKITKLRDAGQYELPLNDGSGEYGSFECKATYRLLITSADTQTLLKMGLKLHRLKVEACEVQREASHFAVVTAVFKNDRLSDTYCVTEPKRHMAVFNGILTGQCVEILEPTAPYHDMRDLYTPAPAAHCLFKIRNNATERVTEIRLESAAPVTMLASRRPRKAAQELVKGDQIQYDGEEFNVAEVVERNLEPEVALCSLAAIVPSYIETEEQYAEVAYYALKMIDKCIHMSDFPLEHIGYTAKQRLSAGVGLTGVAHYMARKRLKYTSVEGKQEHHRLAERHAYHVIRASLRLGQELGNAPWIHRTKWPEGWLPLDTYAKAVDSIADFELQYDWEQLRREIIANGGIRNSTLIAHMPTESSSKASGIPNGLYPIRDFDLSKTDNSTRIDWAPTDGDKLKRHYQIAWDIPYQDQIDTYAIYQKWADQGISADQWIRLEGDSAVYTDQLLDMSARMAKHGQKTRYYFNSKTSKTIINEGGQEVTLEITTEHSVSDKCTSGGCDA